MSDPTKRELRQEKRELKRAGGKRIRRELKRGLQDDPEEAPYATRDFGRLSSEPRNGIDHDSTRRKTGRPSGDGGD